MTEANARGVDEACRERCVSRMKLACRHATRDYLFKYLGHALVVLAHDRPVFSYRGCDQFVQLAVGRIQFGLCLFDGSDQVAHSLGGGASRRGDFFRLSLDPAENVQADRFVDFGFRREEAIDISRRHVQLARDIGDHRLLEADLPEQALRYFDNLAMSILFLGFFFSLHVSTSTIPPGISGTMAIARDWRFPQCLISPAYPAYNEKLVWGCAIFCVNTNGNSTLHPIRKLYRSTESKARRRFSSQHGELVAQRQDLRLERSPGSRSQSLSFQGFLRGAGGDSSTVEQRTLTPSILVRIQVPQPGSRPQIAACL
jgi:hypothetical protein